MSGLITKSNEKILEEFFKQDIPENPKDASALLIQHLEKNRVVLCRKIQAGH